MMHYNSHSPSQQVLDFLVETLDIIRTMETRGFGVACVGVRVFFGTEHSVCLLPCKIYTVK